MTTKRMLIDALHPEETRVAVIDGTRLEDYDVEVASRRQLKGNIYLAKVTRVEPSLQAAFVDYGGNRHGFLAFTEIHPDYYQIPVADRERLLAEQASESAQASDEGEDGDGDVAAIDDDEDFDRRRVRLSPRNYKIQEVIKRRQIMLVQVAKEERGNKGAALTTYLSIAGRYCVLMPNTVRGGGISRKIVSATDRKRLKKILTDLEVPEGMAVIVRTAGAGRSKAEIKRDYDYLMRLWSTIRELTLTSTAPALVYEEGNLIKRSLRDLYERDIEEIIVQGEPEYRTAKEFMKLFIPSHAKRVKLFEEPEQALFRQAQIEDQLAAMHEPVVQLRSGGSIVINPTEALVAIDVNSGRATRERHIEETALRTNLEAADEIARQLRLRDLAGLIVIDFIDMENARNQGQVERRLKEAMKNDRARTQIGRISAFGLLELSRQRLRPSLLETSFETCRYCQGAGLVRTTESMALAMLRRIEEEAGRHRSSELLAVMPPAVAMYLLNQKRRSLAAIEERFEVALRVEGDPALTPTESRIERLRPLAARAAGEPAEVVEVTEEAEPEADADSEAAAERDDGSRRSRRRRGRRRKRSGEEGVTAAERPGLAAEGALDSEEALADETAVDAADEREEASDVVAAEGETDADAWGDGEAVSEADRKRRRRGKRGGRRRSRRTGTSAAEPLAAAEAAEDGAAADDVVAPPEAAVASIEPGMDAGAADAEVDAAAAGAAVPPPVDAAFAAAAEAAPVSADADGAPPADPAAADEAMVDAKAGAGTDAGDAAPVHAPDDAMSAAEAAAPVAAEVAADDAPRSPPRPRRSRRRPAAKPAEADAAVEEDASVPAVPDIPVAPAGAEADHHDGPADGEVHRDAGAPATPPGDEEHDTAPAAGLEGPDATVQPAIPDAYPALPQPLLDQPPLDAPGQGDDAERNGSNGTARHERDAGDIVVDGIDDGRRTAVVRVGEHEPQSLDEPRKGWWQRLIR